LLSSCKFVGCGSYRNWWQWAWLTGWNTYRHYGHYRKQSVGCHNLSFGERHTYWNGVEWITKSTRSLNLAQFFLFFSFESKVCFRFSFSPSFLTFSPSPFFLHLTASFSSLFTSVFFYFDHHPLRFKRSLSLSLYLIIAKIHTHTFFSFSSSLK
jgi:hypothetical protein